MRYVQLILSNKFYCINPISVKYMQLRNAPLVNATILPHVSSTTSSLVQELSWRDGNMKIFCSWIVISLNADKFSPYVYHLALWIESGRLSISSGTPVGFACTCDIDLTRLCDALYAGDAVAAFATSEREGSSWKDRRTLAGRFGFEWSRMLSMLIRDCIPEGTGGISTPTVWKSFVLQLALCLRAP